MKMKAWEWAVWIALCIAPLAAAAAALGSLPDTIALHAEKPAHSLAKANCGLTHVADIGIK